MNTIHSALLDACPRRRLPRGKWLGPIVSETEDRLHDLLQSCGANTTRQEAVLTRPWGLTFWLDFLCQRDWAPAMAIECDGPEAHREPVRDLCRDALILDTYRCHCIWRVPAWMIWKRPHDVLGVLTALEPAQFSDAGTAVKSLFREPAP